ncbi:MAG: YdbH domain-containing protein [Pseudomonadales bacterium]|jgi:hypothetical protein|nr:YdbH domain-containing protein [Pseudomonadales bacterium]
MSAIRGTAARVLAVALLLSVMLLALGWGALPWLAPPLLARALAGSDLRLLSLEVSRPSPWGTRIPRAVLDLPAQHLRLTLLDAHVRWRPSGLLAGEGADVSIAQLDLHPTAAPTDRVVRDPEPMDPHAILPSTWLRRLGASRVVLHHFRIEYPVGATLLELDGHGLLDAEDARLEGRGLHPALDASLEFSAHASNADALVLQLGPEGQGDALVLRGELTGERPPLAFDGVLAGDLGWLARAGLAASGVEAEAETLTLDWPLAGRLTEAALSLTFGPGARTETRLHGTGATLAFSSLLDAPLTLTTGTAPLSLVGSIPGRLQIAGEGLDLRARLRLDPELADPGVPALGVALDGEIDAMVAGAALHSALAFAGVLRWQPAAKVLSIDRDGRLDLETSRWERLLVEESALLLPAGLQLSLATEGQPRAAPFPVEIHAAGLAIGGTALGAPAITLEGEIRPAASALQADFRVRSEDASVSAAAQLDWAADADGALRIDRLDLDLRPHRLPAQLAEQLSDSPWPLHGGTLHAEGLIRRGAQGGLAGSVTLTGEGLAGSAAPLDFDDGRLRATSDLDGDRLTLRFLELELGGGRLTSGEPAAALRFGAARLQATGTLDLTPALPARLEIAARVGTLASEDLLLEELTVTGPVTHLKRALAAELELQAPRALTGITVEALRCGLHLEGRTAQLEDCGGDLLGGRLTTPRARLRVGADGTLDGYLPIAIQGIDLGETLALMQDPALGGDGILEGSLPLRIERGVPLVEDGRLGARPPGGRLHYRAEPDLRARLAQPGLALALDALADFRYARLDTTLAYAADGTLDLALQIEGVGTDANIERPIRFNLNVTQNLPLLLQSLRLSQNIDRSIQRRLQGRSPTP